MKLSTLFRDRDSSVKRASSFSNDPGEHMELIGKKTAAAQSTSGGMPESGLEVLNQDGHSIEVALARQPVG
ncbi:MAG TPA: hypothetical protein PLQ71_10470 [Nitrospira sp.]|nr:hypothetical protein [Nitrospira sp.]